MPRVRTFHSRLFWKIYISFASLFLCAAIALSWVVFLRVQRTVKSTELNHLKDKVSVYYSQALRVCSDGQQNLSDFEQAIHGNQETQISLSFEDGRTIVANSPYASTIAKKYWARAQSQLGLMVASSNRGPESTIIFEQPYGQTRETELVAALKIFGGDQKVCILWVSRVSQNFHAGLRELWNTTGLIAVFGIVTALALGWSLVRKIMIPISEMVDVAEALRQGNYDRRVQVITKDELGRLGDSLNKLGGEMMRKMSEVERLENVRRDFVANVSHEIKTPLTSIKGYVETLQSGALEDPKLTVRFLEKIERNAARLTALVQDILSLAKIESLEDSFQLGPVEWNEVIHSVVSRCEDAIGQKHLRLKLNIPQAPVYVSGDREAMIQVLDNLLTNAIKYTADGGLITLTLYHKNNWAKIEVEDTGIGIPSEHLPRIFERFYRVDKARSRDLGGTGLGLSIVKHLVSGMGGEVTVTSSVGVGSIFSVRLKVARYQQTSGH